MLKEKQSSNQEKEENRKLSRCKEQIWVKRDRLTSIDLPENRIVK
jgi:hypothetical protein